MTDIFVKTIAGKTIQINIALTSTVAQLKAAIALKENVPVDQQRLLFAGKQMEDTAVLSDLGVEKDSTIHLVMRLRGGVSSH
jgi:hypothetical protein